MRSLFNGPLVRLIPVGLVFLALQRTFFAEHPLDDVVLQVVLALATAAGAGGGPERGALAGFILGLMYDFGVGTPLGLSALAYTVAGLVAGYVRVVAPHAQWWFAMLFVGVGAAAGESAVAATKLVVGDDGWVNTRLLTIVPVVALFAALLSPLLVPLGRWCMNVKQPKWKAIPE